MISANKFRIQSEQWAGFFVFKLSEIIVKKNKVYKG